jgi:cell division protein FtsI/penicillin-binding protein 2
MLALANNGVAKDIRIFKDSARDGRDEDDEYMLSRSILSPHATEQLKSIMDATTNGGTASFAFRRGKYRKMKSMIGGKTGTLTGSFPKGVITWFTGMMPMDNPEVVVSAVVALEDLWHIKAPNLAAEAVAIYEDYKEKENHN